MKKIIFILLIIFVSIVSIGIYFENNYFIIEGNVLVSDTGSYLVIDELGTPIVMTNKSKNEEIFTDLTDGDEIKIICGYIRESFPAGTDVYYCKKLSEGEYKDLPEDTISDLIELGWIKE